MLFHVRMHVHLPHDLDPTTRAASERKSWLPPEWRLEWRRA
jgi:muconolactone delta-isomerase